MVAGDVSRRVAYLEQQRRDDADAARALLEATWAQEEAEARLRLLQVLATGLADPVEVLFGVQLGGGTDINAALAYCEKQIENPRRTHLVLITDLYEGGDTLAMLARAAAIKQSGISMIVLLALSDSGHPPTMRSTPKRSGLDCPVFARTPD